MTAKDILESILTYDHAADEACKRVTSIESDITFITSRMDKVAVKTSGNHDFSDSLDRLIQAKREANEVIDQYIKAKSEASALINMVEDPREQQCLRARYLDYHKAPKWEPLSWEEIADREKWSRSTVTRTHAAALEKLEIKLQNLQFCDFETK